MTLTTVAGIASARAETILIDCDMPEGLIAQTLVVNQAGTLKIREYTRDGEIHQRDVLPKEWEKKQFRLTVKKSTDRASLFSKDNRWWFWLSAPNYNHLGAADCDRFQH